MKYLFYFAISVLFYVSVKVSEKLTADYIANHPSHKKYTKVIEYLGSVLASGIIVAAIIINC